MKLTIITITKNNINELKQTINSVNSQNTGKYLYEHLIIDGNSTDGTVLFLKSQNSTFISEEDNGIYDAFNKGVKNSNGTYITFLNSGDIFANSEVINCYLNSVNSNKYIYWFKNIHLDSTGNKIRTTIVPRWAVKFLKIMPPHQSTLIRRELFENNFYDTSFKIAGDYDFFLKNYNNFTRGIFINTNTIHQFIGGVSNNGIYSLINGNKEVYSSLKKYSNFPVFFLLIKLLYKFLLRCKNLIF